MAKKSVSDLSRAELEGKVVFVRADLNVRAGRAAGRAVGGSEGRAQAGGSEGGGGCLWLTR